MREREPERRDGRRGCVSGLFPVFSCVFGVNSLIINAIHFSGLHAFSGGVRLSEPLIYLILLMLMMWVGILFCYHIWFVFNFRFVSGVFMCFWG